MEDIRPIREKIDKIDEKLIRILNERASLGQEIADVKNRTGSPVFLPARENEILARVESLNKGPLSDEALKNIFREIFSATRSVERELKVACLGPAGTFSHLAASKLFGSSCEYALEPGIDRVFRDVERSAADFGVAPIENSIEGEVGQTLDLLMESDVSIYGELYYQVSQNLLSKARSLKEIKTLYSHYMPLRQCRRWLAQNLPSARVIETSSTADAAKKASRSPKSAAIGAADAAKMYGLTVLAEKIDDRPGNQTRFFVISQRRSPRSGNDKTSVMFAISDAPGALGKILRPFATKGLNLTKIQSRPSPKAEGGYVFFVDFDGHEEDADVKWALKRLESQAVFFKRLGSYPKAKP